MAKGFLKFQSLFRKHDLRHLAHYTTGLKPRQFLGGLNQNLVWPSCRASLSEQFLLLRNSQQPPITTENGSQFMSKLRFLNIFFLKPGLTKKFYFIKAFQFSLDGAVSFMPEIFNFGCSV